MKSLSILQQQGLIFEAWQDRQIEPGDEWCQAILTAMNDCHLALLLIGSNFLASLFIREKELSYLFQRLKNEEIKIIPIIIRPCLWQCAPILKNL